MLNSNLEKLNSYFENYIDKMIIKDIELMEKNDCLLKFSFPHILVTCSGIDFFGGIENDFSKPNGQGNSKDRFIWFVTEWMGKVNNLYKNQDLAYLIYESWRCGVSHEAMLKKGFEASSYYYPRNKHLYYIKDKNRIFIHSLQFADDFINAQKRYREYINTSSDERYINKLWDNLSNMLNKIKTKKEQSFNKFVSFLESKKKVFDSSNAGLGGYSLTKSSFPYEQITTSLSDYGDINAGPSGPPPEDGL